MAETSLCTTLTTPIGRLLLTGDGERLTGLYVRPDEYGPVPDAAWRRRPTAFSQARDQLQAYFAGELRVFEIPLQTAGTRFQRAVWQELRSIPFGGTVTYAELAARVGRPSAVRAVGAANAKNPISVVVPCHRVVGSDGSLTGYGGGLPQKAALLRLEGVAVSADGKRVASD